MTNATFHGLMAEDRRQEEQQHLAGRIAGLKEAAKIAEKEAYCEKCFADFSIAIRSRIAELEGK